MGTVVFTATPPVFNSAILFKTRLSTLATSQHISNISLSLISAQLSPFVLLNTCNIILCATSVLSCFVFHVVFFQTSFARPSSLSPVTSIERVLVGVACRFLLQQRATPDIHQLITSCYMILISPPHLVTLSYSISCCDLSGDQLHCTHLLTCNSCSLSPFLVSLALSFTFAGEMNLFTLHQSLSLCFWLQPKSKPHM